MLGIKSQVRWRKETEQVREVKTGGGGAASGQTDKGKKDMEGAGEKKQTENERRRWREG